jgi:hypothetical protein
MLKKQTLLDICQQHFDRYGNQHDALDRIVAGDETWIHHCEPENKRLSMG